MWNSLKNFVSNLWNKAANSNVINRVAPTVNRTVIRPAQQVQQRVQPVVRQVAPQAQRMWQAANRPVQQPRFARPQPRPQVPQMRFAKPQIPQIPTPNFQNISNGYNAMRKKVDDSNIVKHAVATLPPFQNPAVQALIRSKKSPVTTDNALKVANFGKESAQGIARGGAQLFNEASKPLMYGGKIMKEAYAGKTGGGRNKEMPKYKDQRGVVQKLFATRGSDMVDLNSPDLGKAGKVLKTVIGDQKNTGGKVGTLWGKNSSTQQGEWADTLKSLGVKENTAYKLGAPLALWGTVDDAFGAGGTDNLAKAIAKTGKIDDIVKLTKGMDLGDDVIKKLVKETDPKKIGGILDGVKGRLTGIKDITGRESKVGDNIEFDSLLGGKKGRTKITYEKPSVSPNGVPQKGRFIGNGSLDNGIPFKIVDDSPKNVVSKNVGKVDDGIKWKPSYPKKDVLDAMTSKETVVHYGKKISLKEYYAKAKGVEAGVVKMSPDDYIRQSYEVAVKNNDYKGTLEQYTKNIGSQTSDKYALAMKKGDAFEMPMVDRVNGAQEGLHRAMAAKKSGAKEIPVLVVDKPGSLSQPTAKKVVNPKGKLRVQPPQKEVQQGPLANLDSQEIPDFLKPTGGSQRMPNQGQLQSQSSTGKLFQKKQISNPYDDILTPEGPDFKQSMEEIQRNATRSIVNSDNKKAIKDLLNENIGQRKGAEFKAYLKAKNLNIPQDWDIVRAMQGKKDVKKGIDQYIAPLRKEFDAIRDELIKEGARVPWLDDYITQIWDNKSVKKLNSGLGLGQKFKFAVERQIPSYDAGIKMGLKPKYDNPVQIYAEYVKRAEETKANIQLFKKLKENGMLVDSNVARENPGFFKEVIAENFPKSNTVVDKGKTVVENYYAPTEVAEMINSVFVDKSPKTFGDKAVKFMGDLSSGAQKLVLSGGAPYSPVNFFAAFGVGQKQGLESLGQLATGRITKGTKNLADLGVNFAKSTGISDKRVINEFTKPENVKFIDEFYKRGMNFNTPVAIDELKNREGLEKLAHNLGGKGWFDKATDHSTFKRFLPLSMLSTAKNTYKNAIKKGISDDVATKLAVDTVEQMWNPGKLVDDVLGSQTAKDLVRAGFIAPRYRKQLVGWYGKLLNDTTVGITKKSGQANRDIAIGAGLTYLAYEALNKKYTGHSMGENPEGKQEMLMIPDGKGGTVAIPLFPSLSTMPRMAIRMGRAIKESPTPAGVREAASELRSIASIPISKFGDIAKNQDYFGNPIFDEDADGKTQSTQIASNVFRNLNHPWVRFGMNVAGQKLPETTKESLGIKDKPMIQHVSEALEMPIRFYSKKQLDGAAYYSTRDKYIGKLNTEEKKQYDALHAKQTSDKTVYDSIEKATTYLRYPKLYETDRKIALEVAKKTGAKADPLYTDLTPEQAKAYHQYQTMPYGGADRKDWRSKNKWYSEFSQKRSTFFDSLPKSERKAAIEYPDSDEETERRTQEYYKLPTNKRQAYLKANPGIVEQWDKQFKYTNDMRSAQGYSKLKGFPKATPQVQAWTDKYLASSKPMRKSLRNSQPQMYQKMAAYFDATNLYTIGKEASLNQLQGQPDTTSKELKAISNLARDIYKNADGTYRVVPAGWMQGLSNDGGGYGKSGKKGRKFKFGKSGRLKKGRIKRARIKKVKKAPTLPTPKIKTMKLAKLSKAPSIKIAKPKKGK